GAFVVADPYALLAFGELRYGITHQATASSAPKLGAPGGNGVLYYLWSLTWGLGWIPSIAALAGAIVLWRKDRRHWWVLVPTCVVFLVFMGSYARFFGRYLLPILPLICLLAAHAANQALAAIAKRHPRLRRPAIAAAAVALCGQGFIYSVHSSLILARPYTSATARQWMVAYIPPGSRIVVEPVMPADWTTDIPGSLTARLPGARWAKYPTLRSVITPTGTLDPAASAGEPAGYSPAHPNPVEPTPTPRQRHTPSPTTARSSNRHSSSTASPPIATDMPRAYSTSTGASTTTRWPTSTPDRNCASTGSTAEDARHQRVRHEPDHGMSLA